MRRMLSLFISANLAYRRQALDQRLDSNGHSTAPQNMGKWEIVMIFGGEFVVDVSSIIPRPLENHYIPTPATHDQSECIQVPRTTYGRVVDKLNRGKESIQQKTFWREHPELPWRQVYVQCAGCRLLSGTLVMMKLSRAM